MRKKKYNLDKFEVYRVYTITNRICNGCEVTNKAFDGMIALLDNKAPDLTFNQLIEMVLYYGLDLVSPNVRK